ncbi:MAG: XRE family transcriptional regulator [Burkholderiaceae bacterium]
MRPNRKSDTPPPPIGERLAILRHQRGLTLAALARQSGISEATLSRVENGAVSMNAHNLYILAKVLEVDITTFFRPVTAPMRSGLRSITRAGHGERGESARYAFELLTADVSAKRMVPSINTVTVASLDEAGGLQAHEGEEFVYVLQGAVEIHTDLYRPERLGTGDSMYFDSNMAHAYVRVSPEPARILVVTAIEPGTPLPPIDAGGD